MSDRLCAIAGFGQAQELKKAQILAETEATHQAVPSV